ncbi:NAD(P)-dependent alcohol dehydrogenase [Aquimarina sp. ERC-38]|uniref:NADPH-dependent aldehyde reductase Ahr n=1 Tax=Aquimarina sp. ERC-38 TaxID=2949996 RepID=UPI0022472031|nr:NAD(P)-dependent alcohol dehydrogenase [Aquimarina sp. ERC-38]UZO80310.1 NAD(P)-dependent alcohol dehydrogenase [Aquimarina sp. ERC-38]
MKVINAFAAQKAGGLLTPYSYKIPEINYDEVDIKIHYCGICHSDLSVISNDWGNAQYPLVPGHEIVGEVEEVGNQVKHLKKGDLVGLGWFSESCMHCNQCLNGSHNLCPNRKETIIGRHGGFADKVRCHWSWATPLPKGIDMKKAGPLLCGGITVFNPILMAGVKPTDTVGVIGIGGLGHMALQFLNKWGCKVVAFTSSMDKKEQILKMGAHEVINSKDLSTMEPITGRLDFILNTTNVSLPWDEYLNALAPQGTLHTVGAVLEPMQIPAFGLIGGEKTLSGSPLGSPALTRTMLDFCIRHDIYPIVEEYPMDQVNDAIQHLKEGKARYRIVLKA